MMAAVLPLLDAIIMLAGGGACVSVLVFVTSFIAPAQTPQRARDRRRWYKEKLKEGRVLYQDTPEDRQLARLIHSRNLRENRRERVFLPARVTSVGHALDLTCTVLDLSDTGARLAFGHAVSLPRHIELEIRQRGRRVRAEVVWSQDNTCGIRFIAEISKDESLNPAKPAPARQSA